jgi:hypothetical protein
MKTKSSKKPEKAKQTVQLKDLKPSKDPKAQRTATMLFRDPHLGKVIGRN